MVPLDELQEYPRKTRLRRYLPAIAIGVAVAVVLFFLLQPTDDAKESKRLPSFDLPLLDGGGTLSADDLRGQPTVINFFASWCLPCREEARLLERTFKEYETQGVQFVGVNIEDTEDNAKRFLAEFGVTYPVIKDYDKELATDLGVTIGLPQTFFVTEDLFVATKEAGDQLGSEGPGGTASLGAISEAELRAQIEALLEAE